MSSTQADEPREENASPDVVKDSWLWIKDSRGYGSVTVTLLCISFWATTAAYVLSWFEGQVFGLKLRPFDVAASASYFGAICAMYTTRKWTSAKFKTDGS